MTDTGALFIRKLELEAFRAFAAPAEIDFGRRLTIVFGANGTGKSSIAQAIEFCLTGIAHGPNDETLPTEYLRHDRVARRGSVRLHMSSGPPLVSGTHDLPARVRDRFRDLACPDWPDRQALPITLTHVLSQGLLRNVLQSDESGEAVDVTSVCVGSDLRIAAARAERMEDAFRQRAGGRKILEEIRRAEERFQAAVAIAAAAKPAPGTPPSRSSSSVRASLHEVALRLGHEAPDNVSDEWLVRLSAQAEAVLSRLQAERAALESVLDEAPSAASRSVSLEAIRQRLGVLDAEVTRVDGIVKELRGRSAAEEANLAELEAKKTALAVKLRSLRTLQEWQRRLQELQLASNGAQNTEQEAKRSLEAAQPAATAAAQARSAITHQHRVALETLNSLQAQIALMGQVVEVMGQLPSVDETEKVSAHLADTRNAKNRAQSRAESLADELERRVAEQRQAQDRLEMLSGALSAFTAAITTFRALAEDRSCPLCGHRHADRESLLQAIDAIADERAAGTVEARQTLANAQDALQETRGRLLEARAVIATVVTEEARLEAELEQLNTAARIATERASRLLAGCGLDLQPSDVHPEMIRQQIAVLDALRSELAQIERERQAAEQYWVASDAALAATKATYESAEAARMAADAALEFHRKLEPYGSPPVDEEESLLQQCSAAEQSFAIVTASANDRVASLSAAERLLEDATADRAALTKQRSLLDAEEIRFADSVAALGLKGIADSEWAQRRAALAEACDQAALRSETVQRLRAEWAGLEAQSEYEKSVAVSESCEVEWRNIQAQQKKLSRIHDRFRELRLRLDEAKRSSATTVLSQIREPARMLFRTMVGGAPYDLDFRYEGDRLVAGLTVPDLPDVPNAAHLLSAAQLNVAALSLRLALAARQSWCRLRTAILDDPILEMDSLTQAGYLDGLESLFESRQEGWRDLQIIMTTWSEEFAYLAAHRLAHLNSGTEADGPAFTMYRVKLKTDGTPELTRFEPRWGARQSEGVA